MVELKRLIIATRNRGKIKEFKELFQGTGWQVISMDEAGIDEEIVEDGMTFDENALIKARAVQRITGDIVLADDSGLEVDFLNRAPGIYTSRFLQDHTQYAERYQALLRLLEGVPDPYRKARFVCSVAVAAGDQELTVRGVLDGRIAQRAAGSNGFGYDPVFWVPQYGKTLAELDSETKNQISHRGKAFRAVASRIREIIR